MRRPTLPDNSTNERFKLASLTVVAVGGLLTSVLASPLSAAPSISQLSVRGLQAGATTVVTVDGGELLPDSKLVLPIPIAGQTMRSGATAQRVEWEVTLPAEVTPGIYSLRIANARGVSNAVPIGIDSLRQEPWAEEITALPVARHAVLQGDQRLTTRLTGKKGQRLLIDVESQRTGGAARPVVRLYDGQGAQLAWSGPRGELAGDARLVTTLPADGVYQVEVHDVLYRAPGGSSIRVKLGDLPFADAVLPTGVTVGQKQSLEYLLTSLAPTTRVEMDATAIALPSMRPAPRPAGLAWTGAAPRVAVSEFPEVVESAMPAGATPTLSKPPVAYSARIGAAGEEDRITLEVTPGSRLQFDVQARSLGSPLDGVLTVFGPQGNALASNDDRPGTPDPGLDLAVPAEINKVVVALHDLQHRGGPDYFYRLVIRDLNRPDFTLTFDADRLQIPSGGSQVIAVQVGRQNYVGPIRLSVDSLPPGIQLAGDVVPAGANVALVSLTAAEGSATAASVGRLIGRSVEGEPAVSRLGRLPERPLHRTLPWEREELAVAVAEPGAIRVAWSAAAGDETLPLGWKLPLKVALRRDPAAMGNVQLRLVTTQPIPKKTVKQNNMDVQVDDTDRALRLENPAPLAAAVVDATAMLLVPPDLPAGPWGVALVAELLGADNKTVVAASSTSVRYLPTRAMLALMLSSAATLEGKSGGGETGKVAGKIVRDASLTAPVTVTLVGLPDGYVAPKIEVPAGQVEFTMPLNFPAGTKVGEVKGARVVATAPVDPQNPAAVVRSVESPITINVVAGN